MVVQGQPESTCCEALGDPKLWRFGRFFAVVRHPPSPLLKGANGQIKGTPKESIGHFRVQHSDRQFGGFGVLYLFIYLFIFPRWFTPRPAFFCLVVVQGNERDTKRNPLAFPPPSTPPQLLGRFFQGQPKETKRSPILVGPIPEEKKHELPMSEWTIQRAP